MRTLLLAVAVLLVVVPAASARTVTSTRALVRVVALSPFTVRGVGFRAAERVAVSVAVLGGRRYGKTVVAGSRGGFGARFRVLEPLACRAYVVRATGNKGSKAALRVPLPPCGADPAP